MNYSYFIYGFFEITWVMFCKVVIIMYFCTV